MAARSRGRCVGDDVVGELVAVGEEVGVCVEPRLATVARSFEDGLVVVEVSQGPPVVAAGAGEAAGAGVALEVGAAGGELLEFGFGLSGVSRRSWLVQSGE